LWGEHEKAEDKPICPKTWNGVPEYDRTKLLTLLFFFVESVLINGVAGTLLQEAIARGGNEDDGWEFYDPWERNC